MTRLRRNLHPSLMPTLIDFVSQALRVGANWRSVIPALAKAVVLHKEKGPVPKASKVLVCCEVGQSCRPQLLFVALNRGRPCRKLPALCATQPALSDLPRRRAWMRQQ